MCGIAGLVGTGWSDPVTSVAYMLHRIVHRGPDGRGQWRRGSVAFGHVRLAIVDRSHEADQPMRSADDDLAIVFNGQIYNHVELRVELEGVGRRFRTRSDTEVLLAAYQQWGRDCLPRLNGMFAFAIADFRRGRVFCARDRFGIKPLLFAQTTAGFAFGSEAKQLLDLLPARRADLQRVAEFVLAGLHDHDDRTCFDGIERLAAGHWLEVDFDGRRIAGGPWYSLAAAVAGQPPTDAEQYAQLFDDAVRLRLRADVPVGTCLSGGLDSSNVAASAAPAYGAQGGGRMHAITASSEDPANDERDIAARVVEHLGLAWTVVRPGVEDFIATWDALHWHQDEPVGGPSLLMQWHVMKAARAAGLTVMLDGQGGDETLLGYDRYWPALLTEAWRYHGPVAAARDMRALFRHNEAMSPVRLLAYAIGGRLASLRQWAYRRRSGVPAIAPLQALREYGRHASQPAALAQVEIGVTSLPALLRYEDRNSMAHGVEARLPFLDYRLVESALRLRPRERSRDGWSKWPLREQLGRRLPDVVRWRRQKLGFNAPDRLWLPKAAAMMRAEISASRIIRELSGGRPLQIDALATPALWRLASVACWERIFRL